MQKDPCNAERRALMMGGLYMEAVKMKWDEIVEKYPDRWVALSDYEKDGPYIPMRTVRVFSI